MKLKRVEILRVERGDQVVMIPSYLDRPFVPTDVWVLDNEDYPSGTQMGFVTSVKQDLGTVYVRYLYPLRMDRRLRTVANSEGTHFNMLWWYLHSPRSKIDDLLTRHCSDPTG